MVKERKEPNLTEKERTERIALLRMLSDFPWLWAANKVWIPSHHKIKVIRNQAKIRLVLGSRLADGYKLWLYHTSGSIFGGQVISGSSFVEGIIVKEIKIKPEEAITSAIERDRKENSANLNRIVSFATVGDCRVMIYVAKNWKDLIESARMYHCT
jgi:hypothetical protein